MSMSTAPSSPESLSCGSTSSSAIPSSVTPPSPLSRASSLVTDDVLDAPVVTIAPPPPLVSVNSAPSTVNIPSRVLALSDAANLDPAFASSLASYDTSTNSDRPKKKRSNTVTGYDHPPQPFFPASSLDTHSRVASPTSLTFPTAQSLAGMSASVTTVDTTTTVRDGSGSAPGRRRKQGVKGYSGGGQGGSDANQLEAKVVILGSQGVGKTSIVHRYTTGHFSHSLSSTIGASFLTKKLVIDDCRVRLQIWDTAGQERFRSMAPLYYRHALAAVIVYDITDMDSFFDVRMWLDELRHNMSPDLIIHVVGSKSDLSTKRQISLDFARLSIAEWYHAQSTEDDEEAATGSAVRGDDVSPVMRTGAKNSTTTTNRSTSPPSPSQGRSRSSTASLVRSQTTPNLTRSRTSTLTRENTGDSSTSATTGGNTTSGSGSTGMIRSGSKLGIGGLSLGMARRKSTEDDERRRREEKEQNERRRLDELVRSCPVTVSEVSAKDDEGIEDLFLSIANRLVERKARIESERVLRSRDSVMLHEDDGRADGQASSSGYAAWCCA